MNINFTKIDPTCYNIIPIKEDECPQDSLSTIGINFSALDAEICNLSYSAINYWNPLYTLFEENSGDWDAVYNTVKDNSACWQSTYVTVLESSAYWLTPISVVYSSTFQKDTTNLDTTILAWVKDNFPVEQSGCLNYLNGQRLRVFVLKYAIEQQTSTCNCTASGGVAKIRFIGIGSRSINCGCSCKPGRINASDRYVDSVAGYEYVVTNKVWTYLGTIY